MGTWDVSAGRRDVFNGATWLVRRRGADLEPFSNGIMLRSNRSRPCSIRSATIPNESALVGFVSFRRRSRSASVAINCRSHLQAIRAVPGGGGLHRLRASFPALGAMVAFALHGGFGASLLAGLEDVLRHWSLHTHHTRSADHAEQVVRHSLKVVVPIHAVKRSLPSGSTS